MEGAAQTAAYGQANQSDKRSSIGASASFISEMTSASSQVSFDAPMTTQMQTPVFYDNQSMGSSSADKDGQHANF